MSTKEKVILTLLNLKGIGPSLIGKNSQLILERFNKGLDIKEILKLLKKNEFDPEEIDESESYADSVIQICNEENIQILSLFDSKYPKVLETNRSKFPLLFYKGSIASKINVGLIGSRDSSDISLTIAERIGEFCAKNNVQILSGLAEGVDSASVGTELAMQNSLGVVPGGLQLNEEKFLKGPYLSNARQILNRGGSLISQFTPLEKQDRYKVIEYCKLQAAMSHSLILVQSSLDGGSRFTVEHFCKYDRTLFVVDSSQYDNNKEAYSANNLIIEKGKEGVSEWCKIPLNRVKCSIEIIRSKDDYNKILSLQNSTGKSLTLF